jgi:hypothetical protein
VLINRQHGWDHSGRLPIDNRAAGEFVSQMLALSAEEMTSKTSFVGLGGIHEGALGLEVSPLAD